MMRVAARERDGKSGEEKCRDETPIHPFTHSKEGKRHLLGVTASISSMKMIEGAFSFALSNKFRRFSSLSPEIGRREGER